MFSYHDRWSPVRAVRGFDHDPRRGRVVELGLLQDLAGVALPLPFQPPRQAQDHDVEEAADQQAEGIATAGIAEAGV
jgi:hypothetical protein